MGAWVLIIGIWYNTFADLMSQSYQSGADVMIAFNASTGILIKNHTIEQLSSDDFLFA
jgi:hypothetical protein